MNKGLLGISGCHLRMNCSYNAAASGVSCVGPRSYLSDDDVPSLDAALEVLLVAHPPRAEDAVHPVLHVARVREDEAGLYSRESRPNVVASSSEGKYTEGRVGASAQGQENDLRKSTYPRTERSVCSHNAIPCDHFSETISFTLPRIQPHGRHMSRLPGDVGFTSSSALLFASSPALSVSCARSLTNSARYVPMMWSKVVASTLFLARSSSICGSCTSVRLHKQVLSLSHSLTLSLPLPLPRTETGVNQKDRTNADYCSTRKRDPGRVSPVMASTTGAACERDTYHAGENS